MGILEELIGKVSYDHETGKMFWLPRDGNARFNAKMAGKPAFDTPTKTGYLKGGYKGKTLLAHRVAYTLGNGEPPVGVIDHINLDKTDNRSCNLRDSSVSQNMFNRVLTNRNKSGYKGVSWCSWHGKWRAALNAKGRCVRRGFFDCPKEAYDFIEKVRAEYHGEYVNNGEAA